MRDFGAPDQRASSMDAAPAPRFFRWALVVLPAGLVVLTAISFVFWHQRKQAEADPRFRTGASEIAMAKPVDGADLRAFVDRLASAIGPRPTGDPAALRRAVNYLESTMGQRNMGFNVLRERIGGEGDDGDAVEFLVAVVEGEAPRGGAILVSAPYGTGPGTPADPVAVRRGSEAVATFLTVAHAWVGSRNRRPIVFLLHPGDGAPPEELLARLLEIPVFASIGAPEWLDRFAPAGPDGAGDPEALEEAARRLDREIARLAGG